MSIKTRSRLAEGDERDRSKIDPGGGAEEDADGGRWAAPHHLLLFLPLHARGIMMPHRRQEAAGELEQASRN